MLVPLPLSSYYGAEDDPEVIVATSLTLGPLPFVSLAAGLTFCPQPSTLLCMQFIPTEQIRNHPSLRPFTRAGFHSKFEHLSASGRVFGLVSHNSAVLWEHLPVAPDKHRHYKHKK